MASGQQSPNKKGERNSNRSNGKAATTKKYGDFGQILTGKGKPSGNSVVGVSIQRVMKMAEKRGVSFDTVKKELITKRDEKKANRKRRGVGYKSRLADQAKAMVNGG